jgi:hypothetical protein
MPSAITAVPIWRPNLSRPNNGEDADQASLDEFVDELADRTEYLYAHHFRGNFQAEKYGAVGSGAVNDYPAIAAAVAAAVAAGGGTVWCQPGKSYRLDSELVLDGTVAMRTMKGISGTAPSRLIRNHAGRLVRLNRALFVDDRTPVLIEGFKCEDNAANTQAMIDVEKGSLLLNRCWLQGINGVTGGPLLMMRSGEGSLCRVRDSIIAPDTGFTGILQTIGHLDVSGCQFRYPTTYGLPIVEIVAASAADPALATFVGNDFYARLTSSGSVGINPSGDYWTVSATGNHFRAADASYSAFQWSAAGANVRRLVAKGNTHERGSRYGGGGDPLGDGSDLELAPFFIATLTGTSATVPSGVAEVHWSCSSGPPLVTMPPKLFKGQRLRVVIYNASGADHPAPPVLSGAVFANGGSTLLILAAGRGVIVDLVVSLLFGTWEWTIVGVQY